MRKVFYVKWENEYSEIHMAQTVPEGREFSGPFQSLADAKRTLIPFLETKIKDTRKNLEQIRSLQLKDFEKYREIDDL